MEPVINWISLSSERELGDRRLRFEYCLMLLSGESCISSGKTLVVLTSMVSYLLFKRFEPKNPLFLGMLLLLLPALLSLTLIRHSETTLGAVGTVFVSYYSLTLVYVTTYRISPFHPLSCYPGPFLNKLTKFRMVWIAWGGKQHLYYKWLHERYGDVVRIGPNELSFRSVDAVQPLLGLKGLPKGPYWDGRGGHDTIPSLIAIRDPIEHAKRRRLWVRGFTSSALKDYEEILGASCRALIEAFEKRQGQVLDIAAWMGYFSFDTMGALVFAHEFRLMQDGCDSRGFWHIIEHQLKFMAIVGHIPWAFRLLTILPGSRTASLHMIEFGRTNTLRRMQAGPSRRDLFHHFTNEDHLEKPALRNIVSDAALAVIAGSDTTAGTLTVLWYHLVRCPAFRLRLQAEIDLYFPPPAQDHIDMSTLTRMPYLNACLNETLRLFPPVLSGAQRSGLPGTGGTLFGTHFIPDCTQVFVHTYTIHRNPLYFSPFPDTFWPDRWLPALERIYPPGTDPVTHPVVLESSAFIPFSIGPTSCVGKNLALMELRAVTCFVLRHFHMRVADDVDLESWEDGVQDYFVMKTGPLPVVLTPRC